MVEYIHNSTNRKPYKTPFNYIIHDTLEAKYKMTNKKMKTIYVDDSKWKKFNDTIEELKKHGIDTNLSATIEEFIDYFIQSSKELINMEEKTID